ncbi:MAG: endonuclease, partial [Bacteroidales bacterium]|nr:endonuclease [Bacteroidales bacterium]
MKSRIVISILIILACLCPIGALASGCDTLRIRVMTYNLRLGELATLKQLAEHIIAFNPDFVALQEVDVHTMRRLAPHQNG